MSEALRVDADGDAWVAALEARAAEIGYPLLIKAAAGGGGRGMRRVDDAAGLASAVTAAAREAGQAFGDGSVYLERLIEGGRHIEVQLLGDAHGEVVALGERDCSTQRRHQKLVEEAPAPGLTRAQREALHELAVRIAQRVGLRNAATAEFLYAPDSGSFHFLEVNARLQVEHGVTELLTGLDLVREQLFIAAGEPLSDAVRRAAERAATPDRHAIELRISAEDPARDFAPAPGELTRWREPAGPGVRVDSGVEAGWRVPSRLRPPAGQGAGGRSRTATTALARARRALAEFETGGIQTTLPFHAWLLGHPAFVEARLRTDLVAREWAPNTHPRCRRAACRRGRGTPRPIRPGALARPWRAARRRGGDAAPARVPSLARRLARHLARRRASRGHGAPAVTSSRPPARLRLTVEAPDAHAHVISLASDELPPTDPRAHVRPLTASTAEQAAGIRRFEVTVDGWAFTVAVEDEARALLRDRAGRGGPGAARHGPIIVKAPMPGRVVRLWVAEGDTVEAGQRLLAIEAMKMENEVRAPHAGTIASIDVAAGDSVELGEELLTVR